MACPACGEWKDPRAGYICFACLQEMRNSIKKGAAPQGTGEEDWAHAKRIAKRALKEGATRATARQKGLDYLNEVCGQRTEQTPQTPGSSINEQLRGIFD